MKKIKLIIVMMIGLTIFGCSPEQTEETEIPVKYEEYDVIMKYNLTGGCGTQYFHPDFYCYYGNVEIQNVRINLTTNETIYSNYSFMFYKLQTYETMRIKAIPNYRIGDRVEEGKPYVLYVRRD